MSELEVVAIPNGQFAENCYLVADRAGRRSSSIPARNGRCSSPRSTRGGWRLSAIWLTHAHLDHILGVGEVSRRPAPRSGSIRATARSTTIFPRQAPWLGMRARAAPPPDRELAAARSVGRGLRFDVRHTPGHSPGSVSLVGNGVVFAGDVLFSGSIGRSDLPGGDFVTLMRSIQAQLLSLPDATVVYSGHGPDTTIGVERITNPFLTGEAAPAACPPAAD